MQKIILVTILILITTYTSTYAEDEVILITPENNAIIEVDCNEKFFLVDISWSSIYAKERAMYNINAWAEDGDQIDDLFLMSKHSARYFKSPGKYTWNLGYLDKDIYKSMKNTEEGIIWNFSDTYSFELICKETEEEYGDQNNEEVEKQEKVEEQNIKEKNQDLNSEEQSKETPQQLFRNIKRTYTTIKDVFTWDSRDISEIILRCLESIFTVSEEIQIKAEEQKEEEAEKKPLSFPFRKIIGVTQWYGNTVFQQPHTGIDFGATKETILAPADGKVVARGYDRFYENGDCFSGGYYLVIEHENRLHTAYFHIEKFLVEQNQTVKKGDKIAISGNSGKWNCQNLKYHLHFETRKGRHQDTHVNPVEYIDVNWNEVLTLGYDRIPGRLSGENPHPTY